MARLPHLILEHSPLRPNAGMATTESHALGDRFDGYERLIVSPVGGIFRRDETIIPGQYLEAGDVVGTVGDHAIRSPFNGQLQDFLAINGERLRRYERVAWLTTAQLSDAA
jgi:hypothetical protein